MHPTYGGTEITGVFFHPQKSMDTKVYELIVINKRAHTGPSKDAEIVKAFLEPKKPTKTNPT